MSEVYRSMRLRLLQPVSELSYFSWMVVLKLFYGVSFITTPLPLVIVMTFMVGMMCILLGLLAEMIMRTFYESQRKTIYSVRSVRNIERAMPTVQGTGALGGDQALPAGAQARAPALSNRK
jgi:hypothetical protein